MLALLPTSPLITLTMDPPSIVMSLTSNVDPIFFGGRSVMTVNDFPYTRPETEVVPTFHLSDPKSLANDNP
jgi:hypothetical protein